MLFTDKLCGCPFTDTDLTPNHLCIVYENSVFKIFFCSNVVENATKTTSLAFIDGAFAKNPFVNASQQTKKYAFNHLVHSKRLTNNTYPVLVHFATLILRILPFPK